MKKDIRSFGFVLLLSVFSLIGCNENKVYDSYRDLEDGVWNIDTLPTFDFNIENASISHNIYYNVRYAASYPYYNLYLKYYLEDSTGSIIDSELQEVLLFDKKTGEPLGDGLGDIIDREVLIFDKFSFPADGSYSFKVKQFMRTENLPGIMSFGLRIDKVLPKE